MKICLITTFPPSRGGLSEYGFHIARELQKDPLLSLTILADELPAGGPMGELEGFCVDRCWSFNSARTPDRLLRAIKRISPDVVWFNLLFTTFGHNPLAAFYGLTTPLLSRLAGFHTHVTLHHLMDNVDLQDAKVRFSRLYRAAGNVATRMLLLSDSVSVLMPAYRRILVDKYKGGNVHVRPHGSLAQRPQPPDFSRRGNPEQRILAFGKWGTYKRLELLVDAFQKVAEQVPNAKLVIAGTNHPRSAGYVESFAEKLKDNPRVEFAGYVAENQLGELFGSASVTVMPYSSATGASGVAHLACAYGVPIVSADIPDFRQMQQDEGMGIDFYPAGDPEALAECLISLLKNDARQRALAEQNFSAALRMTLPRVVHEYLRYFDRTRRTKLLRPFSRARLQGPRGIPNPVSLAENWATLAHGHSPFATANGHGIHLTDGDGSRSREVQADGVSVYGYGVNAGRDGLIGITHTGASTRATGGKQRDQGEDNDGHPDLDRLTAS
jgi:glycosyltransferase involved in cell wall biosynthesis